MKRITMFALFATLLAASSAIAQTPDAASPVYPHLKELECFVGQWEARATIPEGSTPSKQLGDNAGKEVVLSVSVRWAPGKCAQIVHVTHEVPGVVRILGTSIRAWAQESGEICERQFTTHKGSWTGTWKQDSGKWIYTYDGMNLDGRKCAGKRIFTFQDPDHYAAEDVDYTVEGKQQPDVTWNFSRVARKKPQRRAD